MGFSNPTPPALTYKPATELYVNSGSGNDSAAGTITDPFQSLEEALKNIWGRRLNGNQDRVYIFLSGNTGDADVTDPVVYYWPAGYWGPNLSSFEIGNWDGADTETSLSAVMPATLFSGSSVYGQTYTTDMTTFDGGFLVTLSTDVGGSTPANFDVGTTAPFSKGWWIIDDNLQANPYDGRRPIGHVSAADQIRICGPRSSMTETFAWTSAVRGEMKIGKPGATVDFRLLVDSQDGASFPSSPGGVNKWWNLHISSSSTSYINAGIIGAATKCEVWQCAVDFDMIYAYSSFAQIMNCYVAPNDTHNPGSLDGWAYLQSCVTDGQKKNAAGDFWRGQGILQFSGYNIFQNWDAADTLRFGANTRFLNTADADQTVFHLTSSVGFKGPTISYSGEPVRIIGRVNSVQNYSLAMSSGSSWMWHTGSIVMQDDGTTETHVSVTNGEGSGSCELVGGTNIYNYTSSIDRADPDDLAYPIYETDWSSSYAAILAAADSG